MSASDTHRGPSERKRRLFIVVAVLLSLLATLVCAEIALRAFGPEYYVVCNRSQQYYSNPRGYFDIVRVENARPVYGIKVRVLRWPWCGVRLPNHITDLETGMAFLNRKTAILMLGDSFTWGQGVRYEDTYPIRLEKLLAAHGRPVEIRNAGINGIDLVEIYATYLSEARERHHPFVIYGFVLNDFGVPGKEMIVGSDYIDTNNGEDRYGPLRERFATLNFLIHLVRKRRLTQVTKRFYLEAFKGESAQEHFDLLRQLHLEVLGDGSRLVIALFPLLYKLDAYPFHEIHDKIALFCRQQGILLLDLLPAFSEHEARELWVHATDHHPNDIAHNITAEELLKFMERRGLLKTLPVEPVGS